MVDLHESLRPVATVDPPPLADVAARAKRQRRRRLVTGSGFAAAAVGGVLLVTAGWPRPEFQTTVAESADDTHLGHAAIDEPPTSGSGEPPVADSDDEPTGSETPATTTAPSPRTDAPPEDSSLTSEPEHSSPENSEVNAPEPAPTDDERTDLVTTTGLTVSSTITSRWEDGYCIQIEARNDTTDQADWQVVMELDGTIATVWNAAATDGDSGTVIFTGLEGYNDFLASGSTTGFGACVDTNVDTD